MNDRSLKKSISGKTNPLADFIVGDADENLDLYTANRGTCLDGIGKHSFIQATTKPEPYDEKKHATDPLYTVFEVPLGTLSRLVLEARNVTSKLQSISTIRASSKSEIEPSSKPTRSNSTIRPSNIPTLRPSNIPTICPSNVPTLRSSSTPKKTTTAPASASKRTVSRSLTPVSRKTPSRSSTPSKICTTTSASDSTPKRTVSRSLTPVSRKTPSRSSSPSKISTTTSTTPSFRKVVDAQRSRSLTPRSKPQITSSSASLSKTDVRSASRGYVRPDACTSVSATTPRTLPRLKETVILAFGRPVGTTGNVKSSKRNTSPDVTRTRPKGHSASSLISGVSHMAVTPKSVKPSATAADSTRSGRKLSKASVQMATNHLDGGRNGKASTNPFSSTVLYPHSIRSSLALRKSCGSEGSSSGNSNHEEEEGKILTKEVANTEKNDSARYDAMLMVKDMKDTNWLLNNEDESSQFLMLDIAFDSPPELFPPL